MATLTAAPNGRTLERLENTLAKMAEKQDEFDAAHEILGGMAVSYTHLTLPTNREV